jgi:hypothetical protein
LDEAGEPALFSGLARAADPAEDAAPLLPAATAFEPEEMELVGAPSRPRFAELCEEPAHTRLPRDYAGQFTLGGAAAAHDEFRAYPSAAIFREASEEAQRELDKPAFLRRLGINL